jgi:hypothetical protein
MEKNLIKNLKNDIYTRIGVSKFLKDQVGVICVRDIPKGVDPFNKPTKLFNEKTIELHIDIVEKLDPKIKKMINDFYTPINYKNGTIKYPINENGLNALDISFYLNHSDNPNLECYIDDGDYYRFRSIKNIKNGDELTYDYNFSK